MLLAQSLYATQDGSHNDNFDEKNDNQEPEFDTKRFENLVLESVEKTTSAKNQSIVLVLGGHRCG